MEAVELAENKGWTEEELQIDVERFHLSFLWSFAESESLSRCDPLARLLFISLSIFGEYFNSRKEVGNFVDDEPRRIKAKFLPYDDCDIDDLLEQLVRAHCIKRITVAEFLFPSTENGSVEELFKAAWQIGRAPEDKIIKIYAPGR